jgi:hypothetical protein
LAKLSASRADRKISLEWLCRGAGNAAILRELLKEQPSLERDKRGAIAFAAQMREEMAAWADDLKNKQRE